MVSVVSHPQSIPAHMPTCTNPSYIGKKYQMIDERLDHLVEAYMVALKRSVDRIQPIYISFLSTFHERYDTRTVFSWI